ncbi:MAG: hypothetical protein OXF02_02000 [Simkaniaceae bacterium]|nr:hypothetical protein [Simkaniaceae bacterium]
MLTTQRSFTPTMATGRSSRACTVHPGDSSAKTGPIIGYPSSFDVCQVAGRVRRVVGIFPADRRNGSVTETERSLVDIFRISRMRSRPMMRTAISVPTTIRSLTPKA